MSQAKVDQYKLEKANRKNTIARQKVKNTVTKVVVTVVVLAIVCLIGYKIVTSIQEKREANRTPETYYVDLEPVQDYLSGLEE